jgi:hypothetical protein
VKINQSRLKCFCKKLRFPIEVDSKLKHVKKLLTRKTCSVCCKHKDTSSDPPGEGEGQHNKERQQQHETRFSPTLVIRSYQQVDRKLITSVGGCCYSREIPVAKQKENRRRKIHAVRTHPKNEVKTATAKNSHHSNEKSAAIQLQHVVWGIPSQKHTFF